MFILVITSCNQRDVVIYEWEKARIISDLAEGDIIGADGFPQVHFLIKITNNSNEDKPFKLDNSFDSPSFFFINNSDSLGLQIKKDTEFTLKENESKWIALHPFGPNIRTGEKLQQYRDRMEKAFKGESFILYKDDKGNSTKINKVSKFETTLIDSTNQEELLHWSKFID